MHLKGGSILRRRALLAIALAVAVHLAGCGGANQSRTTTTEVALVYDPGLRVYLVETAPGI